MAGSLRMWGSIGEFVRKEIEVLLHEASVKLSSFGEGYSGLILYQWSRDFTQIPWRQNLPQSVSLINLFLSKPLGPYSVAFGRRWEYNVSRCRINLDSFGCQKWHSQYHIVML